MTFKLKAYYLFVELSIIEKIDSEKAYGSITSYFNDQVLSQPIPAL